MPELPEVETVRRGLAPAMEGARFAKVEARRRVGVMMQEVGPAADLRVREQIDLVASYYPDPARPEVVMEMAHLTPLARRYYGKLSNGQKRQVQRARAGVNTDGGVGTAVRGKGLFELGYRPTQDEVCLIKHTGDGRVELWPQPGVLRVEVGEPDHVALTARSTGAGSPLLANDRSAASSTRSARIPVEALLRGVVPPAMQSRKC